MAEELSEAKSYLLSLNRYWFANVSWFGSPIIYTSTDRLTYELSEAYGQVIQKAPVPASSLKLSSDDFPP